MCVEGIAPTLRKGQQHSEQTAVFHPAEELAGSQMSVLAF